MIIIGGIDRDGAVHRSGLLSDGSPASAVHIISGPSAVGDPAEMLRPHAFTVQQAPNSVLHPHFHFSRQFQLIVNGSGKLGHHALAPGVVHYAAAETAYGPIRAGEDGLIYMTLRQVTEFGAQYLPAKVYELKRGLKRRQLTGEAPPPMRRGDAHAIVSLIAPDETGLAAWLVDVPSGAVAPPLAETKRGDRFFVVLGGSAKFQQEYLPVMSVVWIGAQDWQPQWSAGTEGLRLVVLQFPAQE